MEGLGSSKAIFNLDIKSRGPNHITIVLPINPKVVPIISIIFGGIILTYCFKIYRNCNSNYII